MKNFILLTCMFLAFAVTQGCASGDRVLMLEERMSLLEQHITILNKENTKIKSNVNAYRKVKNSDEQKLRRQSASLSANLDELWEGLKTLNGSLEESNHLLSQRISETNRSLDQVATTTRENIKKLENYLGFDKTARVPGTKTAKQPIVKEKKALDLEIYTKAKQAFDENNFELALKEFKGLTVQFPKSQYADNAQFWIGEIYYREKWYEKAILEYQKVIEKHPMGNKVQASLLKQGISFSNLGDKANARLILTELIKKHPKSNEADIAQKKIQALK
jgi:tol-pal system protein YbgF